MKNIKILIILLSISLNLIGQNVFITGRIQNSQSDSVKIFLHHYLKNSSIVNAKINNGTFSMSFKINQPTPAYLNTKEGNLEMLIFPNDSITINYDDNNALKSIIFEGIHEKEYNYFVRYHQTFNLPYGMFTKPDWSDVFGMQPADFKKYRKGV